MRPLAAGVAAFAVAFALIAAVAGIGGGTPSAGTDAPSGDGEAPSRNAAAAPGRAVFARMGCGSCHTLAAAGSSGQIGPDLDERLASHDSSSLKAAITTPPRASVMPDDFARRMSATELDSLVRFLLAARARAG